ncbi:MAG: NfeD family protein [Ilumatobacteraceae bacterium]
MFAAVAASLAIAFGASALAMQTPMTAESGDVATNAYASTDVSMLDKVDVFEVSGLIDGVVARGIENAVERSSGNGAQALVLQVNSPGAVVDEERMREVLMSIRDSSVPIGVWVGPSGSRSHGWSALLLAVADVSAMAPNSTIGRLGSSPAFDDVVKEFGEASVLLRGNTLTTDQARDRGVLRLTISDEGVPVLRNMLFALDGLNVKGRTLDTVIETIGDDDNVVREAVTTRFFKLGTLEQLMHTSASAALAYLLFSFGLALLVFEFFTAGVGIAGFVGATCSVLGVFGLTELPTRPIAVVLLILAILAFAVDVQVGIPRFWTGMGVLLFVAASLTLYGSVQDQPLRLSWLTLGAGVASMVLAFVVGMPSMVRTRFATPTIGREWLIGLEGVAATDVSPEGEVVVRDARWHARTNRSTPIKAGVKLRVVAIDGVTLDVEPLEGAARDYREMRKPRQA